MKAKETPDRHQNKTGAEILFKNTRLTSYFLY